MGGKLAKRQMRFLLQENQEPSYLKGQIFLGGVPQPLHLSSKFGLFLMKPSQLIEH